MTTTQVQLPGAPLNTGLPLRAKNLEFRSCFAILVALSCVYAVLL